jgi:hypothetical protein
MFFMAAAWALSFFQASVAVGFIFGSIVAPLSLLGDE